MEPGAVVAERFEIERLAGAGGMGRVFRARDRLTGEPVALKVLWAERRAAEERFEREIRILAELRHPGVVRYVAHGRTPEGQLYLVMEWLEGEDLGARIRRAPRLSLGEVIALGRRAADALAAAHARGVIHRDVKPGNLFLPGGDVHRLKLLDFGIARPAERSGPTTRTGIAIGTPGYMAPEQARASRDIDARADVFSLGCVLFECLTGLPPFHAEHDIAVLAKILLEQPPLLRAVRPDAPAPLEALLDRMLSKDPAARPADGATLAAAFASLSPAPPAPVCVPHEAPTVPPPPASLGESERRVMCVLLAGQRAGAPATPDDSTLAITPADALSSTASSNPSLPSSTRAISVQLIPLLGGGWTVTFTGAASATDLAFQAARYALSARGTDSPVHARGLRGDEPRCAPEPPPLALVTGLAEVSSALPVGALLDRAAALLAAAAGQPGEIAIDEVTAGLLGTRFEIAGGGGALVLRGAREAEEPARTLLGRATPCVGRDAQIAALLGGFEAAVEDPGARAALVTAPAGAGKSRLRHELTRRLCEVHAGAELWLGQGDPLRAGSPFGLIAPLLRRAAGILDGEPLAARRERLRARVARCAPEAEIPRIAAFLGELTGAPFDDAEALSLRAAREDAMIMGDQIRRAFIDFLEAECAARPVVLILEDLQWGDRPSLGLIDAALRALEERPLFVLALARPEVHEAFPDLWADRNLQEIHLGPLPRKACERLIRAALGESLPAEQVARLWERSGGNAFCLEELVRAVAEGGGEALPDTVVAMVQARLERLPAEGRRVLRAASVFGQAFWRAGVSALLPREGAAELPSWLDRLAAQELVAARPAARFPGEREYAFHHALVREAAYASLTDADRALGHRLAGAWLERVGETDALTLAEHFERGGEPGRAVIHYRRAAEHALEGNDLGAAMARAERGLACLPESEASAPGELRGALCQIRAEAHRWRGENADAERWGQEAMRCLERGTPGWYRAASEIAIASSRLGHKAEILALLDALEGLAALAVKGAVPPAHVTAGGRAVVSAILLGLGPRAEEALRRLEETAESAALERDPAARGWLFRAQSVHALHAGDAGAYLELTVASVEAFERAGDLRSACAQRVNIGFASTQLGRHEDAERVLREAIAMAERHDLRAIANGGRNNLGIALAHLGRLEEARAVEEEAARALGAQGDRRLEGGSRTYLATILFLARDLEGAEREARRAAEILSGIAAGRAQALAVLARALIGRGDREGALAASGEALALIEGVGGTTEDEAPLHLARTEALAAAGRMEEARAALEVGRDRLLARAARITRPELRQSFLQAVPDHARLLALAEGWLG